MSNDYAARVMEWAGRPNCRPLRLRALFHYFELPDEEYPAFRRTVKALIRSGALLVGRDKAIRLAAFRTRPLEGFTSLDATLVQPQGGMDWDEHDGDPDMREWERLLEAKWVNTRRGVRETSDAVLTGTFKRTSKGFGFVRPRGVTDRRHDIFIPAEFTLDAASGDLVEARLVRRPRGGWLSNREGRLTRVVQRASGTFVGTYQVQGRRAFVVVDGLKFEEPIPVGDPGAKGARHGDKVAIELARYPTPHHPGQGVVVEVLGPRGVPGVDTLTIIRTFNLPDRFDDLTIAHAREVVLSYVGPDEEDSHATAVRNPRCRRHDLRHLPTVTIDPVDARDFDDAISLERDARGHWTLRVHVADVSALVAPGSPMDVEARARGTSVYLPDRVLPMLPEALSNGIASLQPGEERQAVTVTLDLTPEGIVTAAQFARTWIRVDRRFTYEEAHAIMTNAFDAPEDLAEEHRTLLMQMLELAMILRDRRFRRGALELTMPETKLLLDDQGKVAGARLESHDESHQVIEEFMLAANEAVANYLAQHEVPFLRRCHEDPDPAKLDQFAEFVRGLGLTLDQPQSRSELQRVLDQTASTPLRHAVHYALLRSLKQATYTPESEGHYALASREYCHFTSPIRRYPDLLVHRQLTALIEGRRPMDDQGQLEALADHCNKTERRAEAAERDLIRLKMLNLLSDHVGREYHAIVTGVEDFALFCQLVELPAEGKIPLEALPPDLYDYDSRGHSLTARRKGTRYRLGDGLIVKIRRVDPDKRLLEFAPVADPVSPERWGNQGAAHAGEPLTHQITLNRRPRPSVRRKHRPKPPNRVRPCGRRKR
ncbi:VacB and RNase II family 3'-5' exoribonuclease [Isosphaera pallida ATCC 43644]|uniref:Ribonuclease R n=1 Tax=Isosphaera pallida (strain ATCC 43644 / DSM 9630 / IS1B) TaxID=575540 RepID=E8R6H7_ISOPI|nr:VacB/RNase II family 3'-5' exoribonuclease [Isosphaera pallida]ADV62888.1 VacB and RNase II family 3'-5' exoribonuclease [Isosphaera pallida ATCC 43644]